MKNVSFCRTTIEKILTISKFWYYLFGFAVGFIVSIILSVIPGKQAFITLYYLVLHYIDIKTTCYLLFIFFSGFYMTNVDNSLLFTFSKIFIRTRHCMDDAAKEMLKSHKDDQNEPALVMHEYTDAIEKENIQVQ